MRVTVHMWAILYTSLAFFFFFSARINSSHSRVTVHLLLTVLKVCLKCDSKCKISKTGRFEVNIGF